MTNSTTVGTYNSLFGAADSVAGRANFPVQLDELLDAMGLPLNRKEQELVLEHINFNAATHKWLTYTVRRAEVNGDEPAVNEGAAGEGRSDDTAAVRGPRSKFQHGDKRVEHETIIFT